MFHLGKEKRPVLPLLQGIALHNIQIGANIGGKIGFIDHQNVRFGQRGPTFARYFFASGYINDIDRQIRQFRCAKVRSFGSCFKDPCVKCFVPHGGNI